MKTLFSLVGCLLLAVAAAPASLATAASKDVLPVVSPSDNMILRITDHVRSWDPPGGHWMPQLYDNAITFNAIHSAAARLEGIRESMYDLRTVPMRGGVSNISKRATYLGLYKEIMLARLPQRTSMLGMARPPYSNGGNVTMDPDHPAYNAGQLQKLLEGIDGFVSEQLDLLRTNGESNDDIQRGLEFAHNVAVKVLAYQADDGTTGLAAPDAPACGVLGQWCPQSNAYPSVPGITAIWPQFTGTRVRAFAGLRVTDDEFQVPKPYDLNDPAFRQDLLNTKVWGGVNSALRKPIDNIQRDWWANTGAQVTALQVALTLFRHENIYYSEYATAALMAKMTASIGNAALTNQYLKNKYQAARPFQMIRALNLEAGDDKWIPSFTNAPNQEFPCGHCQSTASFTHILRMEFGFDQFPSGPMTVPNAYGLPMSLTFVSLSNIETSVNWARVFGGMHLRNSAEIGSTLGKKVAEYTFNNLF